MLAETVKKLTTPPGVIVAADESPKSMKARFEAVGIPDSLEKRAEWRILIATAPIGAAGAAGVILHPEMLDFPEVVDGLKKQSIEIVVKIDAGLSPLLDDPIEQVTLYAENIAEKLKAWKDKGASATKFRSVFTITEKTPTDACIKENANVQAILAKASQDAGLVPMVEPEVIRTGAHTIARDEEVTAKIHKVIFQAVKDAGVDLTTTILKPNMITPGEASTEEVTPEQVAQATLRVLSAAPKELAGINFLSGGIADDLAESYLNAICKMAKEQGITNISASFGRAVVATPLKIWKGEEANKAAAQASVAERVKRCSMARIGELAS